MGQSGDGKSYRVILLLMVGLAAFSSAMKELNQVREFTREASDLVASWSKAVEPAPAVDRVAPVEIPRTAARLEVCENSQAADAAAAPLQAGVEVAQERAVPAIQVREVVKTVVSRAATRREAPIATMRKLRPGDIDLIELRNQARRAADLKVLMMADEDGEVEISLPPDRHFKLPRINERQFKVGTKEREILLKSLNRSINVRSAG